MNMVFTDGLLIEHRIELENFVDLAFRDIHHLAQAMNHVGVDPTFVFSLSDIKAGDDGRLARDENIYIPWRIPDAGNVVPT